MLNQLNESIATIHAVHNCAKAKTASSNVALSLDSIKHFAVGAKVMLRANGLVNGSLGRVYHIAYLSRRTSGPPSLYQHVALLAVMLEST